MSDVITPTVSAQLLTQWELSPLTSSKLSKHYLLHWSRDYFLKQSHKFYGTVTHQDTSYIILYYKGNPRAVLSCHEVILSFRKHPDYPQGYVIVRGKLS